MGHFFQSLDGHYARIKKTNIVSVAAIVLVGISVIQRFFVNFHLIFLFSLLLLPLRLFFYIFFSLTGCSRSPNRSLRSGFFFVCFVFNPKFPATSKPSGEAKSASGTTTITSPSSTRSLATDVLERARTRFDQFWGKSKDK